MLDKRAITRSIQSHPQASTSGNLVYQFVSSQSKIEPWDGNWRKRDEQLAAFWKSEDFLSSAISNIVETRAALGFTLDGTPRSVSRVKMIFDSADFGKGWYIMMKKVLIDLLTQDNGGFVEIIRESKSENSRVIGLAHLPASRCIRTGNPETPVIFERDTDDGTQYVKLKWYQVMTFEDFPLPDPEAKGRQYCFVSRVLKAARIIRQISTYKEEKISGRFSKQIHVVSGVAQQEIEDANERTNIQADNMGLTAYMPSVILASLDPKANVDHVKIDLASLPENFDEDETLKWYIVLLAMASGGEYQDFAPLPGGGLGSSEQSDVLHLKAQTKGNAGWMKMVEHRLHFHNVVPRNIRFSYRQQDVRAELEQAKLSKSRAETLKIQIESGVITPQIARQIAVDAGDIKAEYLELIGEVDSTPTVRISDEDGMAIIGAATKQTSYRKTVPISVRRSVAEWITSFYKAHPYETVIKTNPWKIFTLEQALVYRLKSPKTIDFDYYLFDSDIVDACFEAGISPNVLRQRIPKNYKIFIDIGGAADNVGNVIAKHEPLLEKREKIRKIQHFTPTRGAPTFSYTQGWGYNSAIGIKGFDAKTQPNIEELLQIVRNSVDKVPEREFKGFALSALSYAYLLGIDKTYDSLNKDDRSVIMRYLQKTLDAMENQTPYTKKSVLIRAVFDLYTKTQKVLNDDGIRDGATEVPIL